MKRFMALSCVLLLNSGCAGLDPSKLIPSAVSSFQQAIAGQSKTEVDLISAWQTENESLKFITASDYNCGNPNSALYKEYASSTNPGTLVSKQQVNKYWTASLNYLTTYVNLLNAIVKNSQSDVTTINNLVSFGSGAAANIPGISSSAAASALKALGTAATDVVEVQAVYDLSLAAQKAQAPLTVAVGYLEKYYPAFEQNVQMAFNAWDECVHEKLLFIRDDPLGKVRGYKANYFLTSNGIDLDTAYRAYVAQRATFMSEATVANLASTLKQILTQNANLANPGITMQTVQSAVQSINTIYTDFSNAANAVQSFGTPANPAPAPKQTKSASTEFNLAWLDE